MSKQLFFLIGFVLVLGSINISVPGVTVIDDMSIDEDVIVSSLDEVDWWWQYHHDLGLTGFSTSLGPETDKVLWTAGSFDYSWYSPQRSSPAVVNNTIFLGVVDPSYPLNNITDYDAGLFAHTCSVMSLLNFGSEDFGCPPEDRWYEAYVIALNATTGIEQWMTRLPDEFYIRGSAAVSQGKVFITASEYFTSPFGHLYCLDAETGVIEWSFPLNETWYVSPVVYDGCVYASGWLMTENSTKFCFLYCLDAATGDELYSLPLGIGEPVDAAAVYQDHVYISVWDDMEGHYQLYCVDRVNISLEWCKDLVGNWMGSAPVISDGYLLVASGYYDGYETIGCYFWCLDVETGDVVWDHYFSGGINGFSTPAVAYDQVFFTVSNELNDTGWLYCVDMITGDIVWDVLLSDSGVLYSSPAVADGKIYVNSMSYLHGHGNLYCVNVENGEVLWQYWLLQGWYSSPVVVDERVCLAIAGQFFVFDDNAPYTQRPTVSLHGPSMGISGRRYNFTINVEDPEGSDLLVIFECSLEYPGWTLGIAQSGETIQVSGPFEEAGEYWLRARVQDEQYAWSNWETMTISIRDVEVESTVMMGVINECIAVDEFFCIIPRVMIAMGSDPVRIHVLTADDDIMISNEYRGFLGNRFMFGCFQADLS